MRVTSVSASGTKKRSPAPLAYLMLCSRSTRHGNKATGIDRIDDIAIGLDGARRQKVGSFRRQLLCARDEHYAADDARRCVEFTTFTYWLPTCDKCRGFEPRPRIYAFNARMVLLPYQHVECGFLLLVIQCHRDVYCCFSLASGFSLTDTDGSAYAK